MNLKSVSVAMVVLSVLVLAASSCASAAEHTIQAGDSYSVEVDLSFMEIFSYSWSSDLPLTMRVTDPTGDEYLYETTANSGTGVIPAWEAGKYTLTWYNDGVSAAHLSFDLSDSFHEVEDALSTLIWILIIVAIVIVSVFVIVVILVVMGRKKAPVQPTYAPPPMASQALATGHCPGCGSPIAPDAAFCQKCGARLK